MKRRSALILAALLLLTWLLGGCGEEKGSLTLLDSRGETLAVLHGASDLPEDARSAYLQIAVTETVELLAQIWSVTPEQAQERLFSRELVVTTAFDPRVFQAITDAPALTRVSREVACAITDTVGNLLAVYSAGSRNNAVTPTAPYSSFKPLSVYLPAIESGQLTWTTRIPDSPHKYIPAEGGGTEPWPSNADGTYSNQPVMLCDALARSLNTVAVKTLDRVGVEASMTFLEEKLGIAMSQERYVLENSNADEILGNIALGYLETGVSPVDMAGYYQIFATGGRYWAPRAVTAITDGQGQSLYTREYTVTQVANSQACDVMNRMLQGVTRPGGTGSAAKLSGVEVAGKTGTGDDHEGNWFVGLIPGYSCAVWHGQAEENRAAELFGQIMAGVFEGDEAKKTQFHANGGLNRVIYCEESGMAAGSRCTAIREGYLLPGQETQPCNIHN